MFMKLFINLLFINMYYFVFDHSFHKKSQKFDKYVHKINFLFI